MVTAGYSPVKLCGRRRLRVSVEMQYKLQRGENGEDEKNKERAVKLRADLQRAENAAVTLRLVDLTTES